MKLYFLENRNLFVIIDSLLLINLSFKFELQINSISFSVLLSFFLFVKNVCTKFNLKILQ